MVHYEWSIFVFLMLMIRGDNALAQPPPDLSLVGSAEMLNDRLRLTPARPQMVGAAWFRDKQKVSQGFVTTFRFQLTQQAGLGPGADGFAFVLQNSGPYALSGRGSAGGFAIGNGRHDPSVKGIPNSVAVFFDTYQNGDARDPSDNYVCVCTNRMIREMHWPPLRLGTSNRLPVQLKDGRVHTARIVYKPPMIRVYLDDSEPVVSVPVDMATVTDNEGKTYVGFTASTGNGWENHDLLGWELRPEVTTATADSDIIFLNNVICMEGRNLCTPKEAMVEPTGHKHFRIILPAHIPWGASVENPRNANVTVTGVHGYFCLRFGDRDVCGPAGELQDNRKIEQGLLIPDQKPGALVMKIEGGRTWFSVNAASGPDFKRNQGFLEFEVQIN